MAPEGVEGWETGGGTFWEWQRHLARALPELAVHDLADALTAMEAQMREVVDTARRAGLPWSRIAHAAGLTAEQAARRWSNVNPQQAPHREQPDWPRYGRTPPQQP